MPSEHVSEVAWGRLIIYRCWTTLKTDDDDDDEEPIVNIVVQFVSNVCVAYIYWKVLFHALPDNMCI